MTDPLCFLTGNNFDIKEFHAVLLKNGAVPLYVLENLVMEWIQEKQKSIKAGWLPLYLC